MCFVCVCLQQHVRRQILKDFNKSENPFPKRNGELQQLEKNLPANSVSEQCEGRSESELKYIWIDRMERVETNATSINRDRSRDDLAKENPDSAIHTKLPEKARQDEELFHVIQQSEMY